MTYTDEQFKILEQALPHFKSVKKEYIRNAPKWLTEQIINVYEAATKKTLPNKNSTCSICVMNLYKIIGKTYFSDLEEREAIKASTIVQNDDTLISTQVNEENATEPQEISSTAVKRRNITNTKKRKSKNEKK